MRLCLDYELEVTVTVSVCMSHGLAEMLKSDPVMATACNSSRCSFSCQENWSVSTNWANF